jgi:hypothetical protein
MRIDTSLPINFSNDGQDSRYVITLTPDDRVPSRDELNEKYGPGNWVIEYRGFESSSSSNRRGITNPENTRRRVW